MATEKDWGAFLCVVLYVVPGYSSSPTTHVRLTGDYKLAVDVNGSLSLCFSLVIDC